MTAARRQIIVEPPSPYQPTLNPICLALCRRRNFAALRIGQARANSWRSTCQRQTNQTSTDRIRALNDDLRQNISRGRGHAVMTTGIAALGTGSRRPYRQDHRSL